MVLVYATIAVLIFTKSPEDDRLTRGDVIAAAVCWPLLFPIGLVWCFARLCDSVLAGVRRLGIR